MDTQHSSDQPNELNELFSALSKAQAEMQSAKKDSENPFFKSKYADLASVWEACRGPLTKNGLCVIQEIQVGTPNGITYLVTRLGHSSGQSISSRIPIIVKDPTNPQSVGSCITYYRRYLLEAICGISSEETEDDGEAAMNRDAQQATSSSLPLPTSGGAPICCGRPMLISKFIDKAYVAPPFYCMKCKNKVSRDPVALASHSGSEQSPPAIQEEDLPF